MVQFGLSPEAGSGAEYSVWTGIEVAYDCPGVTGIWPNAGWNDSGCATTAGAGIGAGVGGGTRTGNGSAEGVDSAICLGAATAVDAVDACPKKAQQTAIPITSPASRPTNKVMTPFFTDFPDVFMIKPITLVGLRSLNYSLTAAVNMVNLRNPAYGILNVLGLLRLYVLLSVLSR